MSARALSPRRRGRDGQTLPVVAVTLVAILAIAALAIDLAMLYVARGEAQRSADAVALAGASAFLGNDPGSYASDAKDRAKEYAALNYIRGRLLDTTTVAEDANAWESSDVMVFVILDSMKVRVHVRRRGIGLWFAQLLGMSRAAVAATAAAEASEAGASACMVPFAIPVDPDAHLELGQQLVLKSADSGIVGNSDPFFAPFSMPVDPNVAPYCPRATGYTDEAWGRRDLCTTCTPQNGRFEGESYGGWHQSTGVSDWLAGEPPPSDANYYPADGYAENVCGNNCASVDAGSVQTILTGDRDGPTSWGVNARLAQDPTVWWNPDDQKVYRGNTALDDYESTPRVVKAPTFDPADITGSDDRDFTVSGFAYFFLEPGPDHGFYDPAEQLEIVGRFLFYAEGTGGGSSEYARVLRLVE